MTLEKSPSHSWWWNSHNSPKHSKWLHSNLQKLDEKVKEMLRLIEEDADSFAKRAEMYYQKRPELVNLVEEFYRAYRSLAERYDYLAGEIRQNIPKALQVQLGLSCDSPKSAGGTAYRQHLYSPLRKGDKTFDDVLRKASQAEDELKDSHTMGKMQTPERTTTHGFNTSIVEHSNFIGLGNDALDFCTREASFSSKGSSSDADAEADHFTPLEKLRQELENLEIENKMLMDANVNVLRVNHALEKKVEALEDQIRSMESNGGLLHSLSHKSTTAVGKAMRFEDNHEDASCLDVGEQAFASTSPRNLCVLINENQVLKQAISERGEEKREAIRQLCLSIDIMKGENQRLFALLASKKRKLHPRHPFWWKIFCMGD